MWQRGRNLQDEGLARLAGCGGGYPAHPKILKILIQTRRG